jgi:hypothetical protein
VVLQYNTVKYKEMNQLSFFLILKLLEGLVTKKVAWPVDLNMLKKMFIPHVYFIVKENVQYVLKKFL